MMFKDDKQTNWILVCPWCGSTLISVHEISTAVGAECLPPICLHCGAQEIGPNTDLPSLEQDELNYGWHRPTQCVGCGSVLYPGIEIDYAGVAFCEPGCLEYWIDRKMVQEKDMEPITEREKREIAFALIYQDYFNHGTAGHNRLALIAKQAELAGFYVQPIDIILRSVSGDALAIPVPKSEPKSEPNDA